DVDLRVHRVDVAMSGRTAPAQVAEAISRLERKRLDVILLARGGGSRADLAAWDSPDIAAAIAECATPVWTALGHAYDQTIADLLAQRSFASPAAAAAELGRDRHGRGERVVDDEAWVSSHTRVRVALAVACVIIVVLAVALALQ